MSFHYLQESGARSSAPSLDGTRFAPSRLTPSPANECSTDSLVDTSPTSLSGTISGHSTAHRTGAGSPLLAAGSPVETLPLRVRVRDLPGTVRDFGLRCSASLARYGLALSSRKTVRDCVSLDSAPSSRALAAWGMTVDGACWELGTLVRLPTSESVCGSWPTPKASDWKRGSSPAEMRRNAPDLPVALVLSGETGGVVNPEWLEWFLGYPAGWTASGALGTGKFLAWQRSHGMY